MFAIYDGREHFYQWDLNRKLTVEDASIKEVHFSNRTNDYSLVVEVVEGLVNVPNILLQDNFKIKVYGYDGEATRHSATFAVKARSKPADYVYTETEVKRWEELEERVLEAINNIKIDGETIKEITIGKSEKVYIQDLEPGFYVIHAPEGGAIVGGTSIHMTKGDSHLMASGDYAIATADAAGVTKFRKSYYLTYSVTSNGAGCVFGIFEADKSSGEWKYTKLDGGSFESNGNKCFVINDSVIADTKKYPSAKAVKAYVDSKLVPIELDVGGNHADNEYYNANTVDSVLVEVVEMVTTFEERISALENN